MPDDGQALCDVHRAAILTLARHAYSQAELESWAFGITAQSDLKAMALYDHPDAAGKGLGRRLMQRAEARIASSGYSQVRVEASASGLTFYEGLGYVVEESGDFPSRGGLKLRAHKLTKSLLYRGP